MAQPPTYNRLTSFSNLTALSPSAPPPGAALDAEYNAIKTTLDAILADLKLIQNDDTTLANLSVGPAQLSTQLTSGFTAPSAWVTGGVYTASPASCVLQSSKMYLCLVSHTAGVFATDLAAGKWLQIFDLTSISLGTATQVAVTSHGSNVATNVQVSLNNLDDNKAATSHTHVSTQISDSTVAGRAMLTAANVTAQQTLLGLGTLAFLNSVTVTSSTANWAFTGKITPASLVSNTNDWAPTGLATNTVVQVNTNSSTITLSGILATTDGDIKILENDGANNITLLAQSASSASANRFSLPRPLVLRPGQATILKYDGGNPVWRLQAPIPTNPIAGAFKNLAIGNGNVARNGFTAPGSPDTTFLVTYDELILEDANGETWRVASGSHTISTATTGAVNGLESAFSLVSAAIFVWVIGNPTTNTIGGLMSLSATAPTLPSGYTFKARVGATFTDSSSHLLRTMQFGRDARYIPQAATNTAVYPVITSGVGTMTTTTFNPTTVSVAAFVPSTATQLLAMLSSTAGVTACAPNASFTGTSTSGTGAPPLVASAGTPAQGWIDLESASVFYGATAGVSGGALQAIGWRDPL